MLSMYFFMPKKIKAINFIIFYCIFLNIAPSLSQTVTTSITIQSNKTVPLNNISDLPKIIKKNTRFGDIVIFIGAGDISRWAYKLPTQMKKE